MLRNNSLSNVATLGGSYGKCWGSLFTRYDFQQVQRICWPLQHQAPWSFTDVLHETSPNIGSETTRTTLLSLGPLRLLSLWRGALCAVCSLYYLYPVSNLSCFSICYPCVSCVFHLCMFHILHFHLFPDCLIILPSHVSIPQVFWIYSCWDSWVQPQFPKGMKEEPQTTRPGFLGIQQVAT